MARKPLAANIKPTAKEAAEAVTAMSGTDTPTHDYTDDAGNPLHEMDNDALCFK